MTRYYEFPCGCRWPLLEENPPEGALPFVDIDVERAPEDCPATWDLLGKGLAKGIFQLESPLGRQWTKKLKPENMEHMTALGAILRPGSLRAVDADGVSMTAHYALRKNNLEEVKPYHPAVDPILAPTYGVLCLHGDTQIAVADGRQVPLRELRVGDRVVAYDRLSGKFEAKQCTATGPTRFGDGIVLTLENGFAVTVTDDHEVLTAHGFRRACDLQDDDVVAVAWDLPSEADGGGLASWLGEDVDVAYLLGQLTGNGSTMRSVALACGTESKADRLAAHFASRLPGLAIRKYFNVRCWYLAISHPELAIGVGGNRKTRFHAWLADLGVKVVCKQKRVPEAIFRMPEASREAYLAGLFDADGYSGKSGRGLDVVSFSSSSPGLLEDVRHLCALSGIMTRMERDGCHLGVVGTDRFWLTIGRHCLLRKSEGKATTGARYGWVPRHLALPTNVPGRVLERNFGVSRRNLCGGLPWVRPSVAAKLGVSTGPIRYMRVRSRTPVRDQQFFGLNVADHRNLVANGIVVHNCYQEQSMALAVKVAGFNEQEADALRKAVGKKLPEEMAKCKKMFLEGAKTAGVVSEEQAAEIFGWIEKSQRYQFNKSHSACYGVTGYHCAYMKAHNPLAFFTAWLANAKQKQDPQQEVYELVNDARLFGISVEPPDLTSLEPEYHTDRRVIKAGLADVKGVGEAQVVKLKDAAAAVEAELGRPMEKWSWYEFLTRYSGRVSTSVLTSLIRVGAIRWVKMSRAEMEAEFRAWCELTEKEKDWVRGGQFDRLVPALRALAQPKKTGPQKVSKRVPKKGKEAEVDRLEKEYRDLCAHENSITGTYEAGEVPDEEHVQNVETLLKANREAFCAATKNATITVPGTEYDGPPGGCSNEARRSTVKSLADLLEKPLTARADTPVQIAYMEEELLGISLTCARIDSCDTSSVNCSCREFVAGRTGFMILGVEVGEDVRVYKTKGGKNPGSKYGRMTVSDGTCSCEAVAWPDTWKDYGHLLSTPGNMVILQVERDYKDPESTLMVIRKAWQAVTQQ